MNKKKNFETVLPEGYKEAKAIDAKNTKTAVAFNLAALIPPLIAVYMIYRVYWVNEQFEGVDTATLSIYLLLFIIVNTAYIILHELVHGAAYKFMTGQKLTFGLTLGIRDSNPYRLMASIFGAF